MPKLQPLSSTAAVACLIAASAGCNAWPERSWDFKQLRDPRAADIERRLESRAPIVENPFNETDDDSAE